MTEKEKVAIIGSGNWGSAIARIIATNTAKHENIFEKETKIWVFEELIDGQKLTEIMNTKHENVKYLPGITLPENLIAEPDLIKSVDGATILVFVLPHQFISRTLSTIKEHIKKGCRAITLIKGFVVDDQDEIHLISDMISESLGIQVSALMGANVANEVAQDMFCETTIGCADQKDQEMYLKLFNTKTFRVSTVSDVYGVEICGSLKNIVALGAGFCDGLSFGGNSKAAIMRIGLLEMKKFAQMFYKGVESETFFESCGVADLITTCVGGRNRKVAEAFVKTGKSWNDLEAELLNGQKLQGTLTCDEVHRFLTKKGKIEEFPLFFTIYLIAQKKVEPLRVFDFDEVTTEFKK